MILVGGGAVCLRAVRHCLAAALPVDAVITREPRLSAALERLGCTVRLADDVNAEWEFVRDTCRDGIVWSVDNRVLLRPPLLELPGVVHFNVHNGLVQQYRGLPEVGLFLAILAGEAEWGGYADEFDPLHADGLANRDSERGEAREQPEARDGARGERPIGEGRLRTARHRHRPRQTRCWGRRHRPGRHGSARFRTAV